MQLQHALPLHRRPPTLKQVCYGCRWTGKSRSCSTHRLNLYSLACRLQQEGCLESRLYRAGLVDEPKNIICLWKPFLGLARTVVIEGNRGDRLENGRYRIRRARQMSFDSSNRLPRKFCSTQKSLISETWKEGPANEVLFLGPVGHKAIATVTYFAALLHYVIQRSSFHPHGCWPGEGWPKEGVRSRLAEEALRPTEAISLYRLLHEQTTSHRTYYDTCCIIVPFKCHSSFGGFALVDCFLWWFSSDVRLVSWIRCWAQ